MSGQILQEWRQRTSQFGVEIASVAVADAVRMEREGTDDQHINRLTSLCDVLSEECDDLVSGERKQNRPPRQTCDSRGSRSDPHRVAAGPD